MEDPRSANALFTGLGLLANVAVLGLVALGLLACTSRRGRVLAARVVAVVGPQAHGLALLVAATATLGSLYYSEVVGFVPCELCWYQRILMYPLAIVLAVGVVRRARHGDPSGWWYAVPFVVLGAPLALYHWLVERVPAFAESSSCSATVPCTVPWFEELGFVTLAYLSLSAFCLVGALLVVGWLDQHREEHA